MHVSCCSFHGMYREKKMQDRGLEYVETETGRTCSKLRKTYIS